jgi:hypothetical protein
VWRFSPQLTAFFTSAAIFASSAAVTFFNANAVGHIFPSSMSHWTRKKNPQSMRILEESFTISIITRIEFLAFAFRGCTIPVPAGQVLCQGLHNDRTTVFVQQPAARIEDRTRRRQISTNISGS